MKQFEKMGFDTEAALKWVDWCPGRPCNECPAFLTKGKKTMRSCAIEYLLSDVPKPPKVPRWTTAKTQGDFEKMFKNFISLCCGQDACKYCDYYAHSDGVRCFHAYLYELVDVQEVNG